MSMNIKSGTIFSVNVSSDEKIFGRVLFNVDDYLEKSKNENNQNYFDVYKKCVLIETFGKVVKEFDETLLKNVAVKSSFIPVDTFSDEDEWEITDLNFPVPSEYITFPEVLRFVNGKVYFCVGEVTIATSFDEAFRDKCGVYPSFGSGYWEVVATLDFAGRKDLIEDEDDIMDTYFGDSDLRENPDVRNEIYQAIGEDPNLSYNELALKHGFDLKRFYR
ncbi:hypothetical protein QF044_001382 [Chryseobacterium sp. W4I1]|nr:hypothetical protein [Chryseobacterium sp. W4I1]